MLGCSTALEFWRWYLHDSIAIYCAKEPLVILSIHKYAAQKSRAKYIAMGDAAARELFKTHVPLEECTPNTLFRLPRITKGNTTSCWQFQIINSMLSLPA